MAIVTTALAVTVGPVGDVVVTEPVQDMLLGVWVREFRFFGEIAEGASAAPLVLTVRTEATSREALEVTKTNVQF